MKLRDILPMDIDMDVFDDYDERCGYAFVGPMKLTDAGQKRFAKALDLQIDITDDNIIVSCEDNPKNAKAVLDFILCAAGYCDYEQYERWFEDVQN